MHGVIDQPLAAVLRFAGRDLIGKRDIAQIAFFGIRGKRQHIRRLVRAAKVPIQLLQPLIAGKKNRERRRASCLAALQRELRRAPQSRDKAAHLAPAWIIHLNVNGERHGSSFCASALLYAATMRVTSAWRTTSSSLECGTGLASTPSRM